MEKVIHLSVVELENLLRKQREATGEYMTRNLSVYSWWENGGIPDIDKNKNELQRQALMSPVPEDFKILKRYLSHE